MSRASAAAIALAMAVSLAAVPLTAATDPIIYSVVPDLEQSSLFISGANLGSTPEVVLGGIRLPLQSASSSKIIAVLPGDIAKHPGTYKLQINVPQPQPDPPRTASMDVTIVSGTVEAVGTRGSAEFRIPGLQTFVVPPRVFHVTVELWGAGGMGGYGGFDAATRTFCNGGGGGGGAYVRAVVPVLPGETLQISIGLGGSIGEPHGGDTTLLVPSRGLGAVAGGGNPGRNSIAFPAAPCVADIWGAGGDFSSSGSFEGFAARTGNFAGNLFGRLADFGYGASSFLGAFSIGGAARIGSVEPPAVAPEDSLHLGGGGKPAQEFVFRADPTGFAILRAPENGAGGYAFVTW